MMNTNTYALLPYPTPIKEHNWPEGIIPLVCTKTMTFNHESYIRECIEGILSQKTTFPVRVYIHDDASTDKTAAIVREYQEKYPKLIFAYYQSINSYSNPLKKEMRAEFLGWTKSATYVAWCEGDDYWSDPLKLQLQVDFMESDPETSVCVHASTVVKSSTGNIVRRIRPSTTSRYFTTDEVIAGGGGLFATNSMLYKNPAALLQPPFFAKSKVYDYPLMIYLSKIGKVYYMDKYLSVYRTGIRGSWTSTTYSGNIQLMLNQKDNSIQLLQEVDTFYERKHTHIIQKEIRKIEFEKLLLMGNIEKIRSSEFQDVYQSLTRTKKLFLLVTGKRYPKVYAVLKKCISVYNRLIEIIFTQTKYVYTIVSK